MEKNQLDKEQDLRYYLDDINYQLKHSYRQKNKLRLTFRVYISFHHFSNFSYLFLKDLH
jgi:hypothetical protein